MIKVYHFFSTFAAEILVIALACRQDDEKGNLVKIGNSARCCKFRIMILECRNHWFFRKNREGIKPKVGNKSEDLPKFRVLYGFRGQRLMRKMKFINVYS